MTEGNESAAKTTAGSLLRAAREKQGLHIAALAAAIKVSPRKLDALEHDRYDELPDATFTRALAQTVCRSLKIDAAPVLALLPQPEAVALDHVTGSLNTPFRERPGRSDPAGLAVAAIRPMVGAGVALLVAAAVVYFVPADFWQFGKGVVPVAQPASAPEPVAAPAPMAAAEPASALSTAAPGASAAASEPAPSITAVALAPAPGAASAAAPAPVPTAAVAPVAAPPAAAGLPTAATPAASTAALAALPRLVQLSADRASWVEARDARGQVLFSRVVQPGESIGFDGQLPIRMTIGNAPATQLRFKGRPVELAASTRDNVARLDLQ